VNPRYKWGPIDAHGLYCLKPSVPIDPTRRSWVVSAGYSHSGGVSVAEPDAGVACPERDVRVRTLKLMRSPRPHSDAAWDVSFMLVVP
jgi:hypothetical protein